MKVPFLDLRVLDKDEKRCLLSAVEKVFDHGRMVMGPEIDQIEHEIASFCKRKYAVSVGSGTDALYLALRALDIGPGSDVITTSLSWIATANAIALTGATPVFADIRNDLNIDPESVARLITKKTKAILTVNFTGKVSDIDSLAQIASKNNLPLVEDGSQSYGARYKGRVSGSFGVISAISHNPMKVFAATGEAGSILCDDETLHKRLVSLRYNGTVDREICMEPSLNGRMDTLQAAVLLERHKRLAEIRRARRRNAEYYSTNLAEFVQIPIEKGFEEDVWYTYTIRSARRDELKNYLEARGIETKIQHTLLMPDQPAYKNICRVDCVKARYFVQQILCIPIHEKLSKANMDYVVRAITGFGPSHPQ